MKKTKMLILLLIIALTISVLPVSYTEAASNKTQVKKAVNNYFKFGKKLNLIKMRNYFWDSSKDNEDDLDRITLYSSFIVNRTKNTLSIK